MAVGRQAGRPLPTTYGDDRTSAGREPSVEVSRSDPLELRDPRHATTPLRSTTTASRPRRTFEVALGLARPVASLTTTESPQHHTPSSGSRTSNCMMISVPPCSGETISELADI